MGEGRGPIAGGGQRYGLLCLGRPEEPGHDVEGVESEVQRAAGGTAGLDRDDHVGEPDAAIVGLLSAEAVGEIDLAQPMLPGAEVDGVAVDTDGAQLAAELGGRGVEEGGLGAVELDLVDAPHAGDVPAQAKIEDRAGYEFEHAIDGGRRADGDRFAVVRAGSGDRTLRSPHRAECRDAPHRTEQVDEIGEVVGANVEDRPAAGLEEEVGARVPGFVAAGLKDSSPGGDLPEATGVDQRPRLLVGTAEEGVRRDTHR